MSAITSCDKDDDKDIDTEKPQINASIDGASPANAATFYFGDNLPIEELANKLDTITYEILTGVSRRVKRVYFYE
jgi:hypothetical protein